MTTPPLPTPLPAKSTASVLRIPATAPVDLLRLATDAEAHGRRARLESPPGPGAWFVVELPLAPAGAE